MSFIPVNKTKMFSKGKRQIHRHRDHILQYIFVWPSLDMGTVRQLTLFPDSGPLTTEVHKRTRVVWRTWILGKRQSY